MRNGYGQTTVAPYAVRAEAGAPVATPLHWEELGSASLGPKSWNVKNVPGRLAQRPDPWAELGRKGGSIRQAIATLQRC